MHVDKTGFAIFSPALTIGTTFGYVSLSKQSPPSRHLTKDERPAVGGTFANPVPRLLSPSFSLFVNYPYLLPSLIFGLCGFVSFGIGLAYIPEVSYLFSAGIGYWNGC